LNHGTGSHPGIDFYELSKTHNMKSNRGDRSNSDNDPNRDENRADESKSENRQGQENSDQEFPGYPYYPAKDDIMHPVNRMEKVSPDPENLTRSGAYIDTKNIEKPVSSSLDTAADTDDDLIIVPGTEADVTKEDLLILGAQDIDMDDDEEAIDNRVLSGELDTGLDVPGGELDDSNEELGEEDEENNYYSLGGDRQENLEEN
jgi:hypothetical protein